MAIKLKIKQLAPGGDYYSSAIVWYTLTKQPQRLVAEYQAAPPPAFYVVEARLCIRLGIARVRCVDEAGALGGMLCMRVRCAV